MAEIAKSCGVDTGTVRNRMITFGISRRRKGWDKIIDLTGKRFGRLTVLRPFGSSGLKLLWEAKCECGRIRSFQSSNLISGHSKSCGCIRRFTGRRCHNWAGYGEISGFFWNKVVRNAKHKGFPLRVSIKSGWRMFLRQGRRCALSGVLLHFATSTKFHNEGFTTASLDRIDSDKGYVRGNIQWVHKSINQMKSNLPQKVFVEMCIAVAAHRKTI